MIPPKQVIEEPTSNGVSQMFHGAWYPNVVAQIIPSIGAGGTVTVTLKGSMLKYSEGADKAVTLASDTYDENDGTTPQKLVKPAGEWWNHYWIEISSESSNAFINEVYIGSGGS